MAATSADMRFSCLEKAISERGDLDLAWSRLSKADIHLLKTGEYFQRETEFPPLHNAACKGNETAVKFLLVITN